MYSEFIICVIVNFKNSIFCILSKFQSLGYVCIDLTPYSRMIDFVFRFEIVHQLVMIVSNYSLRYRLLSFRELENYLITWTWIEFPYLFMARLMHINYWNVLRLKHSSNYNSYNINGQLLYHLSKFSINIGNPMQKYVSIWSSLF